MKNSVASRIAFIGVMFALVFVVLFFETAIGIPFIKPSPAFLAIPLSISISMFDKSKVLYGGTMMGVASWILGFFYFPPFINPIVSVLPRILMGIVAYGTYLGVSKLFEKTNNSFLKNILPASLGGAAGVIFNTTTVILLLTYVSKWESLANTISLLITINALFELIAAILLMPLLVKTFRKLSEKIEGNYDK